MKHATNCKFCKAPITLTIDDSYPLLRDPNKLLPLSACNSCADARVWRRKLENKIRFACRVLSVSGKHATTELLAKSRSSLTKLSQDYARMIAQWNKMQGMSWDEECVEQLMEHPDQWPDILSTMWKTFDETQLQPK